MKKKQEILRKYKGNTKEAARPSSPGARLELGRARPELGRARPKLGRAAPDREKSPKYPARAFPTPTIKQSASQACRTTEKQGFFQLDVASRVLRWLRLECRVSICNSAPTEHSRAREDTRSHIIEMASFLHYILYKGTRLRTGKGKRRAAGDFSVFSRLRFPRISGISLAPQGQWPGGKGDFLYIFLRGRSFPLYFPPGERISFVFPLFFQFFSFLPPPPKIRSARAPPKKSTPFND